MGHGPIRSSPAHGRAGIVTLSTRPGTLLALRALAGRAALLAVLLLAGAVLLVLSSAAGRRHRKPFPHGTGARR